MPHRGFMFTDSGKNYSCYETKIRVLSEDWEFAELSKGYDHLWDEAMGKEGSSKGVVYTKLGRDDGKVRRAQILDSSSLSFSSWFFLMSRLSRLHLSTRFFFPTSKPFNRSSSRSQYTAHP